MEAIEAARHRALSVLAERTPAVAAALARLPPEIAASVPGVLSASDFLLDALCRDAELVATLLEPRRAALCRRTDRTADAATAAGRRGGGRR